ncbi:endonuclease/exonuclease/phosphatase family protein [Streptomyces sp. AC627_RSS907]|uniref:endonuclease/exonuclease/phosphatase family protein n=1 Tax=Streptomyces sp. AC627_RSS907 TaxID=2823684 RepID=UPI001C20FC5D|nr:endonuclease/exonuclease/phosphatase family protein [Streptomyces sp. AC627_RSS907]
MIRSLPRTSAPTDPPPRPGPPRAPLRRWLPLSWRRGRVVAALAVTVALGMLILPHLPNRFGNLGSLAQTLLPWTGVAVPVLLLFALARRSAAAVTALTLPALVWLSLHGHALLDKERGRGDLTLVSHNVDSANPDPAGTARRLAESGADVIALEELSPPATPHYERALAAAYPHHAVMGTVGVWSKVPISDTRAVPIMPWPRALRTTLHTPKGPVAVYVAHLASVRVLPSRGFTTDRRNEAADRLAHALSTEPLARTVLVGDLNGSADDRALTSVTSGLRSAQDTAGNGFGFSWPAAFPVVRIDHILSRHLPATRSWTLPATTSDHLPVAASFDL